MNSQDPKDNSGRIRNSKRKGIYSFFRPQIGLPIPSPEAYHRFGSSFRHWPTPNGEVSGYTTDLRTGPTQAALFDSSHLHVDRG